jgi:lysylphosphatidylglycerol synthetase-like protein (DUF2156 family)
VTSKTFRNRGTVRAISWRGLVAALVVASVMAGVGIFVLADGLSRALSLEAR